MDLVAVFKDMISTFDLFQNNRLSGKPFLMERTRADKLEKVFNDAMIALPRAAQLEIINQLVAEGHLDPIVKEHMDEFNGTWGGIKYNYRRMAYGALEGIQTKNLPMRDAFDLASHNVKHLGVSWDDYYKIMAEIKKILIFN